MLIARLIAGTGEVETRLDAAVGALAAAGMPLASPGPLRPGGEVIELRMTAGEPERAIAILDAHLVPADMLVAAGEIALPQLFVSDMDSTMIAQECIDELADYAGLKPEIAAITERAMQGEIDFAAALAERVALLAGLDEGVIATCLAERITPMPGAATLVATLAAHGARTVLVTGGFHHFADPVGAMLGFDRVVGNHLEADAGRLTGRVLGLLVDAEAKAAVLREELARLGPGVLSLATGDGANDIPMIAAASYGFAYRAKPRARAAANGRVDCGDLTAVLLLLGIPRADWEIR